MRYRLFQALMHIQNVSLDLLNKSESYHNHSHISQIRIFKNCHTGFILSLGHLKLINRVSSPRFFKIGGEGNLYFLFFTFYTNPDTSRSNGRPIIVHGSMSTLCNKSFS
jgi:hypothetical protein